MKIEEIKEIKAVLPANFLSCVNLLEKNRNQGYFSAWSVGNADYFISSYWADEALSDFNPKIQQSTTCGTLHPDFDLASLTKPFFLNSFLRNAWKEDFHGFLSQSLERFHWVKKNWNTELLEFVQNNPQLTFNTFLSHRSHFAAWVWCKFFISVRKTKFIKQDFVRLLLKYFDPKNKSVYSDLNYMFLAMLIESLFDIKDWDKQVIQLNQVRNTHFFHVSLDPEKSKFAIPSYPYISLPSSYEIQDEQKYFGVVHDTNANLFALLPPKDRIVSGHAGFFGNIRDVFNAAAFLKQTQPFMTSEELKNKFVYGLEYKNRTLGHAGYTGTSFWFKLQKTRENPADNFILLTNRTAKRTSRLKKEMPRVCIVTDAKNNHDLYFFVSENHVEPISQSEFLGKSKQYFYDAQKIWNDSMIFEYHHLNELRDALGKQIC